MYELKYSDIHLCISEIFNSDEIINTFNSKVGTLTIYREQHYVQNFYILPQFLDGILGWKIVHKFLGLHHMIHRSITPLFNSSKFYYQFQSLWVTILICMHGGVRNKILILINFARFCSDDEIYILASGDRALLYNVKCLVEVIQ